jgi:hypothetical protein
MKALVAMGITNIKANSILNDNYPDSPLKHLVKIHRDWPKLFRLIIQINCIVW